MLIFDHKYIALISLLTGQLALYSQAVYSETNIMLFPELRFNYQEGTHFSSDNAELSLDIFISNELGKTRILTEAYVSEDIQHLERFQFGRKMGNSAYLWMGRFHNPLGYWHTQYHHGTFLQTTIRRPALVEFGGGGGLIPSHFIGMLYEGTIEQDISAWHYALGTGYSSQLHTSGGGHHGDGSASLHDIDALNPKAGNHELGYSLRIAYLPDALGGNQIGGFITHSDITQKDSHGEISLKTAGLFANYRRDSVRFLVEANYFSSKVPTHSGIEIGHFWASYTQLEVTLNTKFTSYGRIENTFSHDADPYLELIDGYSRKSKTAGIRFEITDNHAIKLEYTHRYFEHSMIKPWLLNWTAVLQ